MSESKEDYDVFVSYDELTGEEYAERILKSLKKRGYKVFVAHVERVERSGQFREYIDRIIANSTTFILVNTLDALESDEVIREYQQAFPKNDPTEDDFWIFRHDAFNVPYITGKFSNTTGYDLGGENQIPFKSTTNLSHAVLTKCDKKRQQKSVIAQKPKKGEKLDEEQRKDFSESKQEKIFATEFKKRGYDVAFERDLGNHLSADLILQKKNHWIICEFKDNAKKVSTKIFSQLLKYKTDLELDDEPIFVEVWLIAKGKFNDDVKNEAKKFEIRIIDDSNIDKVLGKELVYLHVTGSIVSYGETKKINFRVDEILDEPLKLKIKNKKGKIIYEKNFDVDTTEWITHEIIATGDEWKQPGELFSVLVEYGDKSALDTIWRSNFGATVELDQKVYSWTDRVYVTLVAPDFHHNEIVHVDIETNEGRIQNYKLVQTGTDTGIFTGEIRLSGHKKYLSGHEKLQRDFFGKLSGQGPTDGLIPCGRNDGVQVAFQLSKNESVVGSALVRWNIGEIQWLDAVYPVKGNGKIRVIDPDMNFNPDEVDTVEVKVWSDSDIIKKSVTLHETNTNTGIFEGEINFDPEKSDESTLRVAEGDTIIAEYVDLTLPDPYTSKDDLQITGTSMIGVVSPPLQRIFVSDFKLTNEDGKEISTINTEKPFFIEAELHNEQDREQSFAFLVQLEDENNVTIFMDSKSGTLLSNDQRKISIKCISEFGGDFSVNAFVWESEDNPTALSPPLTKRIRIEGKTMEDMGIPKPPFEEPKEIEDVVKTTESLRKENIIIISPGSSVPGCEETGQCLIPSVLEIQLDEEVTWENHDTAAHTITSGTSEGGPDGNFDSSLFMAGTTYSIRFTKKGVYSYFDMVYPWIIGVIIVK